MIVVPTTQPRVGRVDVETMSNVICQGFHTDALSSQLSGSSQYFERFKIVLLHVCSSRQPTLIPSAAWASICEIPSDFKWNLFSQFKELPSPCWATIMHNAIRDPPPPPPSCSPILSSNRILGITSLSFCDSSAASVQYTEDSPASTASSGGKPRTRTKLRLKGIPASQKD
jgi:hypothetical protein